MCQQIKNKEDLFDCRPLAKLLLVQNCLILLSACYEHKRKLSLKLTHILADPKKKTRFKVISQFSGKSKANGIPKLPLGYLRGHLMLLGIFIYNGI